MRQDKKNTAIFNRCKRVHRPKFRFAHIWWFWKMNGKKLSQMDRAKYHAANGYISETAAIFKQLYRREEEFKHRIKYNTKG